MEFFFYSFAVCLGQFTGHILALPVYYGIFNAIVIAVYALLNWVMRAYYFGYGQYGNYEGLITWCTPVLALIQMDIDVYSEVVPEGMEAPWVVDIEGLWIAGVYAIVAVVLVACAVLLYRCRHLESAGDVVSVKVMRPVFKYGVAACAGLFFGMLMYEMFGLTQIGLMIAVVLWGIVGYFVAQMLLDKTVRVFKKWKGAAAVTAAFLVLFAVIGFDLTGYETRVPAAGEVSSVGVVGLYSYPSDSGSSLNVELTDPECIADVVALHEAIVKYGEDGEPNEDENYSTWNSVRLTYTLKSGRLVTRSYNINFGEELSALGQKLLDKDEVRRKTYEFDVAEQWQSQGAKLEVVSVYQDQDVYEIWGGDAMSVWNAMMADFEAGNIGIHVLVGEQDWYDQTLVPGINGGDSTCELEFRWSKELEKSELDDTDLGGKKYWYMQIVVLEKSAETRAVLEELLTVDNRYQDDPDDNPLWRTEG